MSGACGVTCGDANPCIILKKIKEQTYETLLHKTSNELKDS